MTAKNQNQLRAIFHYLKVPAVPMTWVIICDWVPVKQ